MRTITITLDENLAEAAEREAASRNRTLEDEVVRLVEEYSRQARAEAAQRLVREMQAYVRTGGRRFTREELNEP
jgi:hypothetical protein